MEFLAGEGIYAIISVVLFLLSTFFGKGFVKFKKKFKQTVVLFEEAVNLVEYSSKAIEDDKITKKEWQAIKERFADLKKALKDLF